MKKKRICQGYEIIDSVRAGHAEIVLGHNLNAPQPYVTWKAYDFTGYADFCYGHYWATHQQARADFYERIRDAWEHYEPQKHFPERSTEKKQKEKHR